SNLKSRWTLGYTCHLWHAGLRHRRFFGGHSTAQEKSIVVASTTEAQDSGLFDRPLPIFKQRRGITVNLVSVGTGRALDAGRRALSLEQTIKAASAMVKCGPLR